MAVPVRVAPGLVVALIAGCGHPGRPTPLGPVSVVVTDEQTGSPLAGIPVDAAWEVARLRGGLGGMIEPVIGTKVVSRGHAVTDSTGTALLAQEPVRLASNEELFQLHLFVNLEVDPSASVVADELETIRERCRSDARACRGEPSSVDAAISLLYPGHPAVFRNPEPAHRGLALMAGDAPGAPDWSTSGDPFHVRWMVTRLEGEVHVEASLAPAIARGER